MKKKIFFRLDADSKKGLGHLVRSISIANIISDVFDITFIIKEPDYKVYELLKYNIINIPKEINEKEELEILSKYKNNIFVIDLYNYSDEYQIGIKKISTKFIIIDDQNMNHFYSDIVINHIIDIDKNTVKRESYTKLFLGADYSMLRKEFLEIAKQKRTINKLDTILINMGGSDYENNTLIILKEVIKSNIFKNINIIIGPLYKFKDDLKNLGKNINIYSNLNAKEMCDIMIESNIIICPISTIIYEASCVGMFIITGYISETQKNILKHFNKLSYIYGDIKNIKSNDILNIILKEQNNIHNYIKKQKSLFNNNQETNILSIFKDLL